MAVPAGQQPYRTRPQWRCSRHAAVERRPPERKRRLHDGARPLAESSVRRWAAAGLRDETRLILEVLAFGLAVLITLVLAVVALNWFSPRSVDYTGAVDPGALPSECCDLSP